MRNVVLILVVLVAVLVQVAWMSSRSYEIKDFVALHDEHHAFMWKGNKVLEYFDRKPENETATNNILVIHGLAQTGAFYHELDDPKKSLKNSRMISVSMPGFGLSTPMDDWTKDVALEEMRDMFIALLNHLKIHEFRIVGVSTGATVAYFIAAKEPQRCRGVASMVGAIWPHLDIDFISVNPKHTFLMSLSSKIFKFDYVSFPLIRYIASHFLSAKVFLPIDVRISNSKSRLKF